MVSKSVLSWKRNFITSVGVSPTELLVYQVSMVSSTTVFTRLSIMGAYEIFGPLEWALIRGWVLIKISQFLSSSKSILHPKNQQGAI